ncbi:ATP-binding protein [Candidatus Woesearchaeota archaeon]|nr:ATP-binding protein [Candidatus Woesearchaeota archaeon]
MSKINEIIQLQKRELELYFGNGYIQRTERLAELGKDIIKVVIGPRRAGKSFFIIHELRSTNHFGYINFDDEHLTTLKNYDELIASANLIYNSPKILFLDEIQNLPNWELFVNRLQRGGFNLILTGSNSNLLSSELASHLTGRYASTTIFPLSFKEYLSHFGKDLTETEIRARLPEFATNGGFPEPLVKNLDYKSYLKSMYDSILFKDILKRHKIKSINSLDNLSAFLMANWGNPYSYQSLAKAAGIKSTHTVEKYLGLLEEAFLLFELNAFSFKMKEQIKSNKKAYVIDNGLITAKSFSLSPNTGMLYENLAAIALKKRQLKGEIEFYYYKTSQEHEVDFVVKEGLKITSLIQVSYDISNPKTRSREVRPLLRAGKELGCDNLLLITEDFEAEVEEEWFGIKGKIRYIPLWKWLLNN